MSSFQPGPGAYNIDTSLSKEWKSRGVSMPKTKRSDIFKNDSSEMAGPGAYNSHASFSIQPEKATGGKFPKSRRNIRIRQMGAEYRNQWKNGLM
mmetsp:Transcript_26503/g.30423  ORF Transcript_26503/g.30423 Transcript_26503/m.30423 type:complete len:94 (-) Transcript_26503:610-891(-)